VNVEWLFTQLKYKYTHFRYGLAKQFCSDRMPA